MLAIIRLLNGLNALSPLYATNSGLIVFLITEPIRVIDAIFIIF